MNPYGGPGLFFRTFFVLVYPIPHGSPWLAILPCGGLAGFHSLQNVAFVIFATGRPDNSRYKFTQKYFLYVVALMYRTQTYK